MSDREWLTEYAASEGLRLEVEERPDEAIALLRAAPDAISDYVGSTGPIIKSALGKNADDALRMLAELARSDPGSAV